MVVILLEMLVEIVLDLISGLFDEKNFLCLIPRKKSWKCPHKAIVISVFVVLIVVILLSVGLIVSGNFLGWVILAIIALYLLIVLVSNLVHIISKK